MNERKKKEYQEFIEKCATLFGDYVFLLNYRLNGDEFKPEIPEEKKAGLEGTAARINKYKEDIARLKELEKEYAKPCLKQYANPFFWLKKAILGVANDFSAKMWSYFHPAELKVVIGAMGNKEAVAEEFLHSKSEIEQGGLEKLINISTEYYKIEEKVTQAKSKEEIRKYKEREKELEFKMSLLHIMIEGHKVARLDSMALEVPEPPKAGLLDKGRSYLNYAVFVTAIYPSAYFLKRKQFCHATADAFFKGVIRKTNSSVADIIMENPPENKEEWENLGLYFSRIKDELGPTAHDHLVRGAASIKRECDLAKLTRDVITLLYGLLVTSAILPLGANYAHYVSTAIMNSF